MEKCSSFFAEASATKKTVFAPAGTMVTLAILGYFHLRSGFRVLNLF
jgi:hypothetical protein